jgi:hypothetical protein
MLKKYSFHRPQGALPARKGKFHRKKENKRKTAALASGRHLRKPRF